MIGRVVEVLVEGASEETEHLLVGRHAQQAPEIDGLTYVNDGVAYPGELVKLEITDASDYDLVGRVVERDRTRARQGLPAAKKAPAPAAGKKPRGLTVLH
jgi:ribosomal protein S12 methylthiotransferase